jgi:gliding motility-associated-like protein
MPGAIRTYNTRISGTCSSPVEWQLDNAIGTLKQINDTSLQIQFTKPGKAILKANIASACKSYSSEIKLDYTPVSYTVNLGADTSICNGDTLTLLVDSQLPFIHWTNGVTESKIRVNSTGTYSVTTSKDGVCYLTDTINIIAHPSPPLKLPKDTVVCAPFNNKLNAGAGFEYYLWQDGSFAQTFVVQSAGTYWVKITDRNGCSSSDTVYIKKIGVSPKKFASSSQAAICYGEKVTLNTIGNFIEYKWENGESIAPTYIVERPGTYSIQVRSIDGCIGKDSLIIKDKGCSTSLFVPSAFSPNNDGKNDIFKAHAIGEISFFNMKVFNRWGELVFETNNLNKSWNGVYKNKLQFSNVFVWQIQYRFTGSKSMLYQKGTVALIQ